MRELALTEPADLAVFYAADCERYRHARPEVLERITPEAFAAFYGRCPSLGFTCAGRPIGGVIFDGEQAHIAVLPEFKGRWALLLKPATEWLFRHRTEVPVEVETDNTACLRMLDRHGWQRIRETESHVTYLLKPQGGQRKTAYPFLRRALAIG
jgi:hypothetical protein